MTTTIARRDPRREVLRALGSSALAVERGGASLEVTLPAEEPGRTQASALLSESAMRVHTPGAGPRIVFGAFVDGVQASRAIAWLGVVPVVLARMGAVVRSRIDRRLVTWGDGPLLESRVYVPFGALSGDQSRRLVESGVALIDTTERGKREEGRGKRVHSAETRDSSSPASFFSESMPDEDSHPQLFLRRAVHAVQRDREALERELTERWCDAHETQRKSQGDAPAVRVDSSASRSDALGQRIESSASRSDALPMNALYIDGGLQSSDIILASDSVVSVIKSHHTLYVSGQSLATVMSLAAGERSSILAVETRWRLPVASWYLRLRNPRGHEPLWGLVRVEVPLARLQGYGGSPDQRADEISRGILAESTPLALPDSRWAAMAYGIRDCEVFLRATLGA